MQRTLETNLSHRLRIIVIRRLDKVVLSLRNCALEDPCSQSPKFHVRLLAYFLLTMLGHQCWIRGWFPASALIKLYQASRILSDANDILIELELTGQLPTEINRVDDLLFRVHLWRAAVGIIIRSRSSKLLCKVLHRACLGQQYNAQESVQVSALNERINYVQSFAGVETTSPVRVTSAGQTEPITLVLSSYYLIALGHIGILDTVVKLCSLNPRVRIFIVNVGGFNLLPSFIDFVQSARHPNVFIINTEVFWPHNILGNSLNEQLTLMTRDAFDPSRCLTRSAETRSGPEAQWVYPLIQTEYMNNVGVREDNNDSLRSIFGADVNSHGEGGESQQFCLVHLRGGGYYGGEDNQRNVVVADYHRLFEKLRDRYALVRIGDRSIIDAGCLEAEVGGVSLDYAMRARKNDVDQWKLFRSCKFMVGTHSGPAVLSRLFDKPLLAGNLLDPSTALLVPTHAIILMKKLFTKDGERVGIEDYFSDKYRRNSDWLIDLSHPEVGKLEDNSPIEHVKGFESLSMMVERELSLVELYQKEDVDYELLRWVCDKTFGHAAAVNLCPVFFKEWVNG